MQEKRGMQVDRSPLYLAILVLALAPCAAESFSNWVNPPANVTVANVTFLIEKTDAAGTSIMFTALDGSLPKVVLEVNQTDQKSGWVFSYTGRKSPLDDYIKTHNLTTIHDDQSYNYSYNLKIEKLSSQLTVTKTMSDRTVSRRDNTNISITLSNAGQTPLQVTYEEPLPSYYEKVGYVMVDSGGEFDEYRAETSKDTISWYGLIGPKKTVKISQELKLVGTIVGSDNIGIGVGKATYKGDTGQGTVETPAINASYYQPIVITVTLSKSTVPVDSDLQATVKLSNVGAELLNIDSAKITVSENLKTGIRGDLTGSDNLYGWSGRLEANDSKQFLLDLSAFRSGNMTVQVEVSSGYRGFQHTDTGFSKGTITIKEPTISLDMNASVEGGSPVTARATFDNTQSGYDFVNISMVFATNLSEGTRITYAKIADKDKVDREMVLATPRVMTRLNYPVLLTVSYRSLHGELFTKTLTKNLDIRESKFPTDLNFTFNSTGTDNTTSWYNLTVLRNGTAALTDIRIYVIYNQTRHPVMLQQLDINSGTAVRGDAEVAGRAVAADALLSIGYVKEGVRHEYTETVKLTGKQAIVQTASNATPVAQNASDPMDYMNQKSGNPIELKMLDSKVIVIAVVGSLSVFFVVVFVSVILYKRKVAGRHDAELSQFSRVEETDTLQSSATVYKVEGSRGMEMLSNEAPMPTTNLEILEDYIKRGLSSGKTKEVLKDNLVKNGWLPDVVEVFMK
jgi:hypothetical protein